MVFLQLFRTLEGKKVDVELQNGVILRGVLQTADQFHNVRLVDPEVIEAMNCPQLNTLASAYIRGSTIRYIHLPKDEVDVDLLHDATRRHNQGTQ